MNMINSKTQVLLFFAFLFAIGVQPLAAHPLTFPICKSENCVFVKAGGSNGDGTQWQPYNNLQDVAHNSFDDDVIIVLNSDQELEGGLQLKDGQKLLGQFAADRFHRTALVDCSRFPHKEC